MKRVIIDCERNDLDDIKYCGPQYFGFNFKVSVSEDDKELEAWLRKTLKKYGHTSISIKNNKNDESI